MTLAAIQRIRPRNDNVLVCMQIHANAQAEEGRTKGGIFVPKVAEAGKTNESVPATVVAAGPGHYHEHFYDIERGASQDTTRVFIPMNPDIKPGAKVWIEKLNTGDRIHGDDLMEYRMVREHNIVMVEE